MGTFFPFYRKASLLGLPREAEFIPQWQLLTFFAGYTYGDHLPKETDALFESDRSQLQAGWDMLTALRIRLDASRISPRIFGTTLMECCGCSTVRRHSSATDDIIVSSQNVILKYLNQQLRRFGQNGEEDCPVDNRDLVSWIAERITFARKLADTEKDLLARVFVETGHSHLRVVLKILHEVLARIKDNSPAQVASEILRWHKRSFGWSTPRYYGEAIECVDIATWLAWVPELGEFPEVSSKRGISM